MIGGQAMKRTIKMAALAVVAVCIALLLASRDDVRRFRQRHNM
jgi:hypothetical protein